jgi:tetraacyldisaccharide 4'-kinase
VGNLTAGGAGKTPVVAFLAGRLSAAGAQVAVLTRGHGRTESGVVEVLGPPWPSVERAGDEPLLLGRRLPGVRIWVGADRVDTARRARAAGATVALLDDGFQHRRLARDVDLVVIDEAVGLGTGHLLPWGPLREPASELGRASAVWVRVADRPVPIPIPPGLPVVRARHAAVDLVDPAGGIAPLSRLSGVAVVGFCGIARPSSFERTLRALGAEVRAMHDFPDHHRFSASELLSLRGAAQGGLQLVTTEKDAVRLPADFPAWVVRLGVTVLEGESELARLLAR